MKLEDFTDEVYNLVEDLRKDKGGKQYSDVIDNEGYQYVDIVMEGGGVLGIALVGFTYVLEQAGIRFLQIGGTSAGAINAMLLAGLGTPSQEKSLKILQELATVNMYDFIDGDSDAKDLVNAWLKHGDSLFGNKKGETGFFKGASNVLKKLNLYWQAIQGRDNISEDLGLNPGEVFRQWIENILKKEGIVNTKELLDRLNQLPVGLRHRDEKESIEDVKPMLALVAADISTQTKTIFPKMAELYWKNTDAVNPSNYVRASMSIPGFFHPFRVERIPDDDTAKNLWRSYGYKETLPESCVFIDGGIMSNFPINLFHRPDRVPYAPTFGVKLGTDKRKTDNISTPFTLLSVIFEAARTNLDNDFISRNPDYHKLVSYINTGEHNWLNFAMSDEDKLDLFKKGAEEADWFLREFDWDEYKKIRKEIAQAVNKSKFPKDMKDMMSGDAVPPMVEAN